MKLTENNFSDIAKIGCFVGGVGLTRIPFDKAQQNEQLVRQQFSNTIAACIGRDIYTDRMKEKKDFLYKLLENTDSNIKQKFLCTKLVNSFLNSGTSVNDKDKQYLQSKLLIFEELVSRSEAVLDVVKKAEISDSDIYGELLNKGYIGSEFDLVVYRNMLKAFEEQGLSTYTSESCRK